MTSLSLFPKSSASYLQVPKFCSQPDPCLCLEAEGDRCYPKLQRNSKTQEMLPSSSTSHRCRTEPSVHQAQHSMLLKVWKNDQKDATSHTLPPPLLRYRAAVYKFSQVTMRGILRMEMLGTWVQAKLWAMLGLQRSNKLP